MARAAFGEAVRLESPVRTFFRTIIRDVSIGGETVPEGRKVLMFLGAANRDPRRWERADDYDITRRNTCHVGFGTGIHGCAGAVLARLEGEAVLGSLARNTVQLADNITPSSCRRRSASMPFPHGLGEDPMQVEVAAGPEIGIG